VILSVTSHWRVDGDDVRREVLVLTAAGDVVTRYLPDAHPALVAYLDRAAVAA
jgi:hypothetical protein